VLTTKELQKIEGIGKSTAEKIRELLETGRVAKLEALRQKHPPGVVALLRVQGLGPKALAKLRSELGVASIDDLRRALAAHAVRDLAGFGAKSEESSGRRWRGSTPRARSAYTDLDRAAAQNRIVDRMRDPGDARLDVRVAAPFSETIGDVDVVVARRATRA
jgi:DNA polymerase (family 10)